MIYVIPAKAADGSPLLVRQYDRSWLPLPEAGRWVPADEFWSRRIRDGDVIAVDPPAQEPDIAPAPAAQAAPFTIEDLTADLAPAETAASADPAVDPEQSPETPEARRGKRG